MLCFLSNAKIMPFYLGQIDIFYVLREILVKFLFSKNIGANLGHGVSKPKFLNTNSVLLAIICKAVQLKRQKQVQIR